MSKKTNILFLLLTIGLIWFVRANMTDLRQVTAVLAQAQWPWLAAAFALRLVYFVLFTLIYQTAFGAVGVQSRWRGLLPLTLAAAFIDTTAPLGGTASIAIFMDDARRRGQSPSRTAAGTLLFYTAFNGVFLLILGGALWLMAMQGVVTAVQLTSTLILAATLLGLVALLWLGHRYETRLRWLLRGAQWLVNRAGRLIRRPHLLADTWAEQQAADFAAAARAIAASPRRLLPVLAAALAAHLAAMLGLIAVFAAFRQPLSFPVILAGYAMTVLFTNVSPTPDGIGFVEVALPLVYLSFNLPLALGTAVTLTFRAFSFWLPIFMGFTAVRRLRLFRSEKVLNPTSSFS